MYLAAPALIFIITCLIFYEQAHLSPGSDVAKHMQKALSLDRVLSISHCGWHFVCWLVYVCLPIHIEAAAAIACGLFNAFTAFLVLWIADRYLADHTDDWKIPTAATLIALLVGPCYLRFYNHNYYLGQGSPNVWHNPTTTAVRPFMILIGVMTVDYWQMDGNERVTLGNRTMKKTTLYQCLLGILLLLSTLMKPSFLMMYGPLCVLTALFRLVKGKGRNFFALIGQHLYFLPSACLFLAQFIRVYIIGDVKKGTSGVAIALFKVARLHAPSVLISLGLKMAFPFLVIYIWRKSLFKDKLFQFVFLQFVIGLLTTWTLTETGGRAKSGNFGWGNILASSFLWILCVIWYVKQWMEENEIHPFENWSVKIKAKYVLPGIFLVWHLLGGILSAHTYWHEFF